MNIIVVIKDMYWNTLVLEVHEYCSIKMYIENKNLRISLSFKFMSNLLACLISKFFVVVNIFMNKINRIDYQHFSFSLSKSHFKKLTPFITVFIAA
jgi:hypothetical protein